MTADDVINKYLIAEQNVPLFAFPGGPQIGMVSKGLVVGPVYSWIKKNNKIYWQFDYTIPGNAPGSYYAEQRPEFWKLSTTSAGGGAINLPVTTSLIPKWALPVALGALALFLFK
jgi:hypothetical protein